MLLQFTFFKAKKLLPFPVFVQIAADKTTILLSVVLLETEKIAMEWIAPMLPSKKKAVANNSYYRLI